MNNIIVKTAEYVSKGHPDKLADVISDTILDCYTKQDPNSRVACETLVTKDTVIISGECRSTANIEHSIVVYNLLKDLGYTKDNYPQFNVEELNIVDLIHHQSEDIARGVDTTSSKGLGAGDQGIVYGYATSETEEFLDLPFVIARKLIYQIQNNEGICGISKDAKSQVTVAYDDNGVAQEVTNVVVSVQHTEETSIEDLRQYVETHVIKPTLGNLYTQNTVVQINPTGRFVIGGPVGDTGLTGRKLMVDSYGGFGHHGGGAFSGKDATKVDRSGAYMARYLSKNIVHHLNVDTCEISIAYVIGVSEPCMLNVTTGDTNLDRALEVWISDNISLTP